jgi:hypothetical protein
MNQVSALPSLAGAVPSLAPEGEKLLTVRLAMLVLHSEDAM